MKWVDLTFKLAVIVGVATYILKEIAIPFAVYELNKTDFMSYSKSCSQAMDSNWYIEQQNSQNLRTASEIQLLDCHEYDLLQKHMLRYGVSEYALAELGLRALELHQKPASEMVKQHKFTER
ncbi:TIGR03982 family His-Xaa-Ser system protein [Pseudoalteromonas sp. Isolate6]|uniref:TIGR03982 family His-Xaa-Ser system protein n=1 Tax=Pseudoalteromonas sp. Isolate6 TaxID=2908527 RepID=UPI001EFDD50A|nr:TIGR03982 family His-Xaa-Ser system protein [Pseudoalteromonas sp. Isolate6]MCG9761831.1 TIGR03982 family His-Xaa-Ser system protein [Pseudoalteromonas sp. Isolate6]